MIGNTNTTKNRKIPWHKNQNLSQLHKTNCKLAKLCHSKLASSQYTLILRLDVMSLLVDCVASGRFALFGCDSIYYMHLVWLLTWSTYSSRSDITSNLDGGQSVVAASCRQSYFITHLTKGSLTKCLQPVVTISWGQLQTSEGNWSILVLMHNMQALCETFWKVSGWLCLDGRKPIWRKGRKTLFSLCSCHYTSSICSLPFYFVNPVLNVIAGLQLAHVSPIIVIVLVA